DAPPLLVSNYVAEDGGEAIYRDMEFPLTTSVSTVQRIMKAELERNRRQREVAFRPTSRPCGCGPGRGPPSRSIAWCPSQRG
ncbi:hypothetical protein JYK14_20130, partial [Siccirubricoccus sp. KC 17139]